MELRCIAGQTLNSVHKGNIVHACMLSCFSRVLSVTPWTVAHQAPLSMGFSKQGYWSGLSCPPPGDPPDPGTKPISPALAGGFFTTSATWEDLRGALLRSSAPGILTVAADTAAPREPTISTFSVRVKTDCRFFSLEPDKVVGLLLAAVLQEDTSL